MIGPIFVLKVSTEIYKIMRFEPENVTEKNPTDKNGMTPLHYATKYGHAEICNLFRDHP